LLSIFVVAIFIPFGAQAQGGVPIGVELDCNQGTININVHPEQNEPVDVTCTVKNTGSFKETISVEDSVEGNDFLIQLSESSFELDAGDEETFLATFSASPRIAVLSADFSLNASVDTWGPDPIHVFPGAIGSSAEVTGTVNSLPYSRIELSVANSGTRTVEVGEEVNIQFSLFNDGNRIDNLEVIITNEQEILSSGLKFVSDSFFRASPNPGSSVEGSIVLEVPASLSKEVNIEVMLSATSTLDSSAESSEVKVRVVTESSSGGSGTGDFEFGEFDVQGEDSMAMIAMGVGGVIALILLLVIISRLTKKAAGGQKEAIKAAKKIAKAEKKAAKKNKGKAKNIVQEEIFEEEDFDFGDLDGSDDFDFDGL
jgi:hypothetical protein